MGTLARIGETRRNADVLVVIAALVVAGAVAWVGLATRRELALVREETRRDRTLRILTLFATGTDATSADPRALLTWQPLALTARTLFPDEFESLDRAFGATYPFSSEQIQAAHARWTADWLAWERNHDAEFKLKASEAEAQLSGVPDSALVRARLDAVEREKLERYQRRYEEYIRVAKALQALTQPAQVAR